MNKKKYKLLASFLTFVFVSTIGFGPIITKAEDLSANRLNEMKKALLIKNNAKNFEKDPNKIVRVIVQMEETPAVKNKATNENAILQKQESVKAKVSSFEGAKLRSSFGYLVNGFSMDVKRSEISKIEAIDGVKDVEEANVYKTNMTSSKELTQAYKVWQDYKFKGEGTLVSVIDSGIDTQHEAMVLSEASKAKFSKDQMKELISKNNLKGEYYSPKIPYAYNYADRSAEVLDKRLGTAGYMHGLHVAGIVGANGDDKKVAKGESVQGVAPECQIIGMKVFSNYKDIESAYEDDIVSAIEDSVKLGADVINMSLGVACGFQALDSGAEHVAVKNAVDAGTVVVVAAGNEGYSTTPLRVPGLYDNGTVGSPSTTEDALSVASCENTISTQIVFDYSADNEKGTFHYNASGTLNPIHALNNKDGYKLIDCGIGKTDKDFEGKDLKGNVALMKRGDGPFEQKFLNAQQRGAVGAIIRNNEANGDAIDNFSMSFDQSKVKIPTVMVTCTDGNALIKKTNIRINFNGNNVRKENVNKNDMSDFTSWGPTPNLEFKPEVTSVGGCVWSTFNSNEDNYGNMSGTSMASPHVAGGVSLIVQAIKQDKTLNLSGRDLVNFAKDSIINTCVPLTDKYHSDVPYSPRRQGSGIIQLKDAIDNKVQVKGENNRATIALKQIGKETNFKVKLKNISDKAVAYNVNSISGVLTEDNNLLETKGFSTQPFDVKLKDAKLTFNKDGKAVNVDGSQNITVPAKEEITLDFNITLPENFATEQFVEGFIRFESKDSKIPSVGVPFMGFYGDWNKEQVIDDISYDKSMSNKGFIATKSGEDDASLGVAGKDENGIDMIDPAKICISPNKDQSFDSLTPNLFFLRNAKLVQGEVLDSNGKIVQSFSGTKQKYVKKPEQLQGKAAIPEVLSKFAWDGKSNDNAYVAEGQYTLRFKSTIDFDGVKSQNFDIPVKVDITKPQVQVISNNSTDSNKYKLQWKATDNLSGIMNTLVFVNDAKEPIDSSLITKEGDVYSCNLELPNAKNKITIATADYGMNLTVNELNIDVVKGLSVQFKETKVDKTAAKATISVTNSTSQAKNVTLIVCLFNENNTLIDFGTVKKSVAVGSQADLTASLNLSGKGTTVKCFVWDSLEEMNPYLDPVVLPVK